MNIKKAAMMLTIMLITILSASSFYILTGEAELDQNIRVISSTGIRVVPYQDYEFVYSNKADDPYIDSSGKRYYIRYTGAESGRTVVDLDDTENGNGHGLTKENGLPTVHGTTLTSTYKLFSKRTWGNAKNTEVTRIFIPSSIAIDGDKDTAVLQSDGTYTFDENKGIASNTFEGWNTDTEKDVIYHTGQLINSNTGSSVKYTGSNVTSEYDRTTKISKETYPHVTTYVYLGSENVSRDSNCLTGYIAQYTYQYKGDVKNVFVSNSVNYPSAFFCRTTGGTYLEYALLDDGTTWPKNMGLAYMFNGQSNLKITSNFQLPKDLYQGNNASSTNNMGLRYMFYACSSIEQLPTGFKIPDGINNISGMFANAKKVRGIIELPNSIKFVDRANETVSPSSTNGVFYNAGISASNYKQCNTPLIVRYPVANAVLDNYETLSYSNVYTPQTSTGKVTMIPMTSDSKTMKDNWEKIYEPGAPNYDEGGAYYIRYKGSYKTVYMDKIERTDNDNYGNDEVKNNDYGIDFSAGTKNPCILNTKLRSTYKMFSKKEDGGNTEVKRVFIPSAIAYNGDKSTSGNLYNNNGIASNTFEGYESSNVEKDVIYHTGKLSANVYGSAVTTAYDRTTKISKETYPHITTYVYLGSENISRGSGARTTVISGYGYSYRGDVKNVFVSNSVDYPGCLFARQSGLTAFQIQYALLDNGERWYSKNMGIAYMFNNQVNVKLTENFSLPNKIYENNNSSYINDLGLACFFAGCTYLESIPSDLIKNVNVNNMRGFLYICSSFSGTIEIPESWSMGTDFLTGAGTLAKPIKDNKQIIAIVYENSYADRCLTQANYSTVLIERKSKTSMQSLNTNTIVNVQDATSKIVIEDCTEEISVKVNKVSSEKIEIVDETDYVSVTVNKKVEENMSDEDEVQE